MKMSIVVPVGREPCIGLFAKRLRETDSHATIFYVVDGFTDDDSRRQLNAVVADDCMAHVVLGPGGLAYAYLAGYRAAWKDGCDVLLEMDVGHDTWNVKNVRTAFELFGADFVPGFRWDGRGTGYNRSGAWHRWVLSRWGSRLVEYATADHRLNDWTSGFHAMNRRVLDEVLHAVQEDMPPGRWWQTAVRVAAMRAATNVVQIPISYKPTGRVPLRDVAASLDRVAKLWWNGP